MKDFKEQEIKHIEFIQAIINRMNSNSFSIKGWAITIVSALLALYANNSNVAYIFVAIAPSILFWLLDSYYLQQERKFRGLYNDIVNCKKNIGCFSMPINEYTGGSYTLWSAFKSKTIAWLYGLTSIALLVIGLMLVYWKDIVSLFYRIYNSI